MRPRLVSRLAISALLTVICACSSTDDPPDNAAAEGISTTTEPRHELVATVASNGGTLGVVVGDRVRVVLVGPSWTFDDTSDESVVKASGKVEELPAAADCATGGDCGSVTGYFEISGKGSADILARRADCLGAEESCITGEGAFKLTVDSSGGG